LTVPSFLPLHLCQDVDQGKERMGFDHYFGGEERIDDDVEHLLDNILCSTAREVRFLAQEPSCFCNWIEERGMTYLLLCS
jgi:hypothetical protein